MIEHLLKAIEDGEILTNSPSFLLTKVDFYGD
jgi:hypothetical protein